MAENKKAASPEAALNTGATASNAGSEQIKHHTPAALTKQAADSIPIVIANLWGHLFFVTCPSCRRLHFHGGIGRRISHCADPWKVIEYRLILSLPIGGLTHASN
ncbi:MAG: hypothetical protein ABSG38_16380 [Spirochaetia bacterium]|jgi:hypothetical protein